MRCLALFLEIQLQGESSCGEQLDFIRYHHAKKNTQYCNWVIVVNSLLVLHNLGLSRQMRWKRRGCGHQVWQAGSQRHCCLRNLTQVLATTYKNRDLVSVFTFVHIKHVSLTWSKTMKSGKVTYTLKLEPLWNYLPSFSAFLNTVKMENIILLKPFSFHLLRGLLLY